jgi:SAM-dependent methyltransferase
MTIERRVSAATGVGCVPRDAIVDGDHRAALRLEHPSDDSWDTYWETLPYRAELCHLEVDDFVARLVATIPLDRRWRVLDFGCGFGLVAASLAGRVDGVWAWDSSSSMRQWTRLNTAEHANVHLLADGDPRLWGGAPAYDLIVINSVLQYTSAPDRRAWLRRWRALLMPQGRIVLSDLLRPGQSAWRDIVAVLRFYAHQRRLASALRQRIGDAARHCRARRQRPLTHVGREDLRREAAAADLEVEFLPASLTYRVHRDAAVLTASG